MGVQFIDITFQGVRHAPLPPPVTSLLNVSHQIVKVEACMYGK